MRRFAPRIAPCTHGFAPRIGKREATRATARSDAPWPLCLCGNTILRSYGGEFRCRASDRSPVITVVEIGHSVAAPYAGMILGELGRRGHQGREPEGGRRLPRLGPAVYRGDGDLLPRVQPRQARHHDRPRRSGRGRQAAGADPRSRRCR